MPPEKPTVDAGEAPVTLSGAAEESAGPTPSGRRSQVDDWPEPVNTSLRWSDIGPETAPETLPSKIETALNSKRPKVMLPGDNRLLSDVAADLGKRLAGKLYRRGDDVLAIEDDAPVVIGAQKFRTLVERHAVCCRVTRMGTRSVQVGVTMSESEARGILASPQFLERLPVLRAVNIVRLPVLRTNGNIELLPKGYDREAQTLTLDNIDFPEDMPLEQARTVLEDLLGEFEFNDTSRSLAVAVSGLVGIGGAGLLPRGALRPAFILNKNAEGAGASTLARCIVSPYYGQTHVTALPDEDAEVRKLLLSQLRAGQPYLIFDNIRTRIGGAAIEAFLSSSRFGGRLLGENRTAEYENTTICIFTANGATVTPDMRRRTLLVELHLSAERAEDRTFKRALTDETLRQLRPALLGAVWSLIRYWDGLGRPKPTREHSAFPEWARTIGGIVEAAGYGCPLETPSAVEQVDEDGGAMRLLTAAMNPCQRYTPSELAQLCRAGGVFPSIVGQSEQDMTASHRSGFGKILRRYDNRQIGDFRFLIEGKGHQRRYAIKQGGKVAIDSPLATKASSYIGGIGKPCLTLLPCSENGDELEHTTPARLIGGAL